MRIILIVILTIFFVLFVLWLVPKSQPLEFSPDFIGYYRGFGLEGAPSIFGKQYYLVKIKDNDGVCWVSYRNEGYNHFEGFYTSGAIREEGECLVEVMGGYNRPCPERETVKWGKYYKPDGTLGSEVKEGTGLQTYWTLKGVKFWELELKDSKRVLLSMWFPNGQLHETLEYVDGPFISYYPSGKKQTVGAYSKGKPSGKWIRYYEDGSIKEIEEPRR